MFSEDKYIEVYTDYENNFYLPTMITNGIGYVVAACGNDGEKNPTFIPWSDIKYINRVSGVFRNGRIKFGEENKEEVLKQLKINVNKEQYYTREKIESMILNPKDSYIKEILNIKDLNTIQLFVATLTALENTNEYNISSKVSTYIRARYDELIDGVKETEITLVPTKEVQLEEVEDEEEVDEVVEEEKPKTTTTKAKTRAKSVVKK